MVLDVFTLMLLEFVCMHGLTYHYRWHLNTPALMVLEADQQSRCLTLSALLVLGFLCTTSGALIFILR